MQHQKEEPVVSPAGNRAKQKLQTADRVLEAARQLFAEQGFEETTTRAIAQRAGVATGTVFAHFPDKAGLLAESLRERIQTVLDETYRTIPATTLTDQLTHMSAGLIAYYIDNQRLARELIKHATFQQGAEADAFNQQMRQFLGVCTDLVSRAVQEKALTPGIEPTKVARCYLAFHFFVVSGCLRETEPDAADSLRQLRSMVGVLLAGYRPLPATES